MHGDELLVRLAQGPEVKHKRCGVVVQHDVGSGGEVGHLVGVSRYDRPFAAVVGVVGIATRPPSRRLHEHDIGAELGQQIAGEPAPFVGEIQHSIWTKHPAPQASIRGGCAPLPLRPDTSAGRRTASERCEAPELQAALLGSDVGRGQASVDLEVRAGHVGRVV